MADFRTVAKYDEIITPVCGRHSVRIELSPSYKIPDPETGEFKQKGGVDILYTKVTFYDMESKTQFKKTMTDGQLHYLLASFAYALDVLEGKTESQIKKFIAETPVDLYVSKHPTFGYQFSGKAPRATQA